MSNKATYLGALMDAGVRALGIVGGASVGRSLGGGSVAMTGLGGVLGHEAAAGLLQKMGRNQYVSVGRKGVKPAKVKKQIIINEEDNMSRSLTESLINEGIRALQEQLPTNTKAYRAKTGKMLQRLQRGYGALDMERLTKNPGVADAMITSYHGSGVLKSHDADRAAGMRTTDAQDTIDFIRKRGSGAFRAQGADRDRSFDTERGMMKPYMQAYVGKGRQF